MDTSELYCLHRPAAKAPAAGAKSPLLVLLHGVGADEEDLLEVAGLLDSRFAVCSLRGPIRKPPGYGWFNGMSVAPEKESLETLIAQSSDKILDFLSIAAEKYGTDGAQTYLLGFSQGATMGYTTILSKWPRPGLLAGAVLASGRLMPQLLDPAEPLNRRCAPQEQMDKLPVFVTHGLFDRITPIQVARDSQQCAAVAMPLAALEYREYPGVHSVTGLEDIAAWLKEKLDQGEQNRP